MDMILFMDAVLKAAAENGIAPAEIYYSDDDSFSAKA